MSTSTFIKIKKDSYKNSIKYKNETTVEDTSLKDVSSKKILQKRGYLKVYQG